MKEKKVRQLAAVMFTDIVGYTTLMQGDEEIATRVRARHRKIFQQKHQVYQGEIIQYFGDGTLSVFKSAIKAVPKAIRVKVSSIPYFNFVRKYNSARPSDNSELCF